MGRRLHSKVIFGLWSLLYLRCSLAGITVRDGSPKPMQKANDIKTTANGSDVRSPQEYIVYNSTDDAINKAVDASLVSLLPEDRRQKFSFPDINYFFWSVTLSPEELATFNQSNPQASVTANLPLMEETSPNLTATTADLPNLTSTISQTENFAGNPPTNSTTSSPEQNNLDTVCQEDAPADLKAISWARGRNYITNRCYKYPVYPTHTIPIFMISIGVTPTVVDISQDKLHWFFAPGAVRRIEDEDPQNLGTCKASKAAGTKFGASKNLDVNILKVGSSIQDHLWAIATVATQLALRSGMAARRNAVIVWTLRYQGRVLRPAELVNDPLWSQFIALINIIHKQNGIIVVPAGDDGSQVPVTKLPAVLRTILQMPLVVVGGVNYIGYQEAYSQDLSSTAGDETVWAVDQVECSMRPGPRGIRARGTGFAAATVGGFLAATLANAGQPLDPLVNDPRRFIVDNYSWQRQTGAPRGVIWNRQDGLEPDDSGSGGGGGGWGNATGLAPVGDGDDGPALVATT